MLRTHAANALTLGRLAAAVVLVLIVYHPVVAFWLLVAALASDMVDGQLARRLGTVSERGRDLDPAADALLAASAVLALALARWFTVTDIVILASVTGVLTAVKLSPWLWKYPIAKCTVTFLFMILYEVVVACWLVRAYGWHPQYIPVAVVITFLVVFGYRHRIRSWLNSESA